MARKKFAETLARELELESVEEYYDYIVSSLINGNRSQVKRLFNDMRSCDQHEFLVSHLDVSVGIEKSVLNICIGELLTPR